MKKKILQLIRLAHGGMRDHFFSLVTNLDQSKFDSLAVGPFSPQDIEQLEKQNIKTYYLPIASNLSFKADWHCLQQLKKILDKEKIDLIHMHGSKAALLGRAAAKITRTPNSVFTVHNFIADNYQSRIKKRLLSLMEKCLVLSTTRTITVSQALAKQLINKQHIPAGKIITIYNGINLKDFQPGESGTALKCQLGFQPETIVIGTVSRLIPEKGIDYLLQSALTLKDNPLFPKLAFLVVGDGPFRFTLEKMTQELGLANKVVFTGYRTDIYQLLKVMDIFVLPSLSEGLGIALLEAMALEKPLIGTRVGGIPEIIENEKNGYLVSPGKPEELAEKIFLLATEPERRTQMGKEGGRILHNKFTLEKMIRETESIYLNILD